MNDPAQIAAGAAVSAPMIAILIFLVILTILWLLLPFAVFGIKSRLDKLLKAQIETLEALREEARSINRRLESARAEPSLPVRNAPPAPRADGARRSAGPSSISADPDQRW